MNDQTQQEIEVKGLTAPRVTPADIEAEIASEHYFTALDGVMYETGSIDGNYTRVADHVPLGLLTFCVLVLRSGFTVTGESACASPENFDAEIGRKIARQNAVAKVWPLLGFRLRDRLSVEANAVPDPKHNFDRAAYLARWANAPAEATHLRQVDSGECHWLKIWPGGWASVYAGHDLIGRVACESRPVVE